MFCAHICTHTYNDKHTNVYTCQHTQIFTMQQTCTHMHKCTYHTHNNTFAHMHIHTHQYTLWHTHMHTDTSMHTHKRIHTHKLMHTGAHTHIPGHVLRHNWAHIHTHAHTCTVCTHHTYTDVCPHLHTLTIPYMLTQCTHTCTRMTDTLCCRGGCSKAWSVVDILSDLHKSLTCSLPENQCHVCPEMHPDLLAPHPGVPWLSALWV